MAVRAWTQRQAFHHIVRRHAVARCAGPLGGATIDRNFAMLKALAVGLRRYAPISRLSLEHFRGEPGAGRRPVEVLGHEEDPRVEGLVTSVAALQQQCQDILKELRAVNDRVAQLTLRESQL